MDVPDPGPLARFATITMVVGSLLSVGHTASNTGDRVVAQGERVRDLQAEVVDLRDMVGDRPPLLILPLRVEVPAPAPVVMPAVVQCAPGTPPPESPAPASTTSTSTSPPAPPPGTTSPTTSTTTPPRDRASVVVRADAEAERR